MNAVAEFFRELAKTIPYLWRRLLVIFALASPFAYGSFPPIPVMESGLCLIVPDFILYYRLYRKNVVFYSDDLIANDRMRRAINNNVSRSMFATEYFMKLCACISVSAAGACLLVHVLGHGEGGAGLRRFFAALTLFSSLYCLVYVMANIWGLHKFNKDIENRLKRERKLEK